MTVTYTVGDTREVIKDIADGSVDLIATSPPFYQLRSYVGNDHDDKANEIGSEPDPSTFLDTLLALTAEWGRVLAPHGSIAVELGDTYSGSGGPGGDYNDGGLREGQGKAVGSARAQRQTDTLKARPKSLACIPDLYTIALAYGIHPLTGKESPAGKWLVRNKVVWHRPNPAVGALGDKVRPSTSYIVVATRSPKRWFDLTAVRGDAVVPKPSNRGLTEFERNADLGKQRNGTVGMDANPAGAPPLDAWFDEHDSEMKAGRPTADIVADLRVSGTYFGCQGDEQTEAEFREAADRLAELNTTAAGAAFHDTWTLTTQPSRLAHYAMWPAKLAERLILSMCPLAVCRVCGVPRRRMETSERVIAYPSKASNGARITGGEFGQEGHTSLATTGWTNCGCNDFGFPPGDPFGFRPGVVLDPFAGSGTTLAVADLHGRDAIGIDFDARNKAIYPARYDEVKRALYGTPAPMPGQETFDFAI